MGFYIQGVLERWVLIGGLEEVRIASVAVVPGEPTRICFGLGLLPN